MIIVFTNYMPIFRKNVVYIFDYVNVSIITYNYCIYQLIIIQSYGNKKVLNSITILAQLVFFFLDLIGICKNEHFCILGSLTN